MKIIYLAVSGIALLVCGAMNSVAVAGESQTRSLTLRGSGRWPTSLFGKGKPRRVWERGD